MMAVNGQSSLSLPRVVWTQTVSVMPGKLYRLKFWHSLWAAGNAGLEARINSVSIAPAFSAGGALGEWVRFAATWSSGSNTSATLEIVNTTGTYDGNDFALDNIAFGVTDSVPVENGTWGRIKALFR